MGTRAPRFFARFNRLEFSAPLVEASSGYPELLGQLIDAFTALHPLYDHALKLPGISLSSLHCCFLSRRVPIASVPIQGGIPFLTPCLAACFSHLSVFSFQFSVPSFWFLVFKLLNPLMLRFF